MLRLLARSALSVVAGEAVRLGAWLHGIGGRCALFAGMLFCGSVLKVMGTGPMESERSYSKRP